MYKITVNYKSNIEGLYTIEIETALDVDDMYSKKDKMVDKWFNNICSHIDFTEYLNNMDVEDSDFDEMQQTHLKIELIKKTLSEMDMFDEEYRDIKHTDENKRDFTITTEEI